MIVNDAFLVMAPSATEKRKLQAVNALYSHAAKGWLLTEDQMESMRNIPDDIEPPTPSSPSFTSTKINSGDITITDVVTDWKVSGKTFPVKDKLKELGAKFSPGDKSWLIPKHKADRADIETAIAHRE